MSEREKSMKKYRRLPKKDCEKLTNLVIAAKASGRCWNEPVSLAEATDALVSVYNGDVMLFDGTWTGLVEPFSEKYAPCDGDSLALKMADCVTDLYNFKWWEPSELSKNSDRLSLVENLMILQEDVPILWERMCDILFRGKYKNDYWEAISDAQDKSKTSPNETVQNEAEKHSCTATSESPPAISGPTFARLQRAIATFPTRYPEYSTKPPKLDSDVRPWLEESRLGESDAERRVFGAIIREHFKLSPDTQKLQ